MPLENVQKIETQQHHEKTWFQRFKTKTLSLVGVSTAVVATTSANAAEGDFVLPDFITPVKGAFSGIAQDLGGFFLVVLAISVAIAVFGIFRGGIKKSSNA